MGTLNLSNPKTELLIKDILKDGFGTISGVLNTEKSELLSAKCKEILLTDYEFSGVSQQSPKTGEVYNNAKTRHTAYKTDNRNLIGISQTVDNLIEDILTDEIVNSTLVSLLGKDYKIYTCAIRHASHLSSFVGLHQDGYEQFSIAVFLNDIDAMSPTTVFYKKTHKLPFKFTHKFEAFDTKYFKNSLSPAIGKKGDILFFFNKTLHGMQSSLKKIDQSSVILFAFHPSGFPYSPWRLPDKSRYSSSFISGLGPELRRLFEYNPDDYTNLDGELIIKNTSNNTSRPIDSLAMHQEYSGNYITTIYWFVLYYIFFILRVFRKIFRLIQRSLVSISR